jgi:hypothetical protein
VINVEVRFVIEGQEVSLDSFAQTILRDVRAAIRDELNRNLTRQETLSDQARISASLCSSRASRRSLQEPTDSQLGPISSTLLTESM